MTGHISRRSAMRLGAVGISTAVATLVAGCGDGLDYISLEELSQGSWSISWRGPVAREEPLITLDVQGSDWVLKREDQPDPILGTWGHEDGIIILRDTQGDRYGHLASVDHTVPDPMKLTAFVWTPARGEGGGRSIKCLIRLEGDLIEATVFFDEEKGLVLRYLAEKVGGKGI